MALGDAVRLKRKKRHKGERMVADWDKIIQRIRSEVAYRLGNNNSHKDSGTVIVSVVMMLDCDNRPLVWTIESRKVEPGARAKELLELY